MACKREVDSTKDLVVKMLVRDIQARFRLLILVLKTL